MLPITLIELTWRLMKSMGSADCLWDAASHIEYHMTNKFISHNLKHTRCCWPYWVSSDQRIYHYQPKSKVKTHLEGNKLASHIGSIDIETYEVTGTADCLYRMLLAILNTIWPTDLSAKIQRKSTQVKKQIGQLHWVNWHGDLWSRWDRQIVYTGCCWPNRIPYDPQICQPKVKAYKERIKLASYIDWIDMGTYEVDGIGRLSTGCCWPYWISYDPRTCQPKFKVKHTRKDTNWPVTLFELTRRLMKSMRSADCLYRTLLAILNNIWTKDLSAKIQSKAHKERNKLASHIEWIDMGTLVDGIGRLSEGRCWSYWIPHDARICQPKFKVRAL